MGEDAGRPIFPIFDPIFLLQGTSGGEEESETEEEEDDLDSYLDTMMLDMTMSRKPVTRAAQSYFWLVTNHIRT